MHESHAGFKWEAAWSQARGGATLARSDGASHERPAAQHRSAAGSPSLGRVAGAVLFTAPSPLRMNNAGGQGNAPYGDFGVRPVYRDPGDYLTVHFALDYRRSSLKHVQWRGLDCREDRGRHFQQLVSRRHAIRFLSKRSQHHYCIHSVAVFQEQPSQSLSPALCSSFILYPGSFRQLGNVSKSLRQGLGGSRLQREAFRGQAGYCHLQVGKSVCRATRPPHVPVDGPARIAKHCLKGRQPQRLGSRAMVYGQG